MEAFLADLIVIAPLAGGGTYAFRDPAGGWQGFVQLIWNSDGQAAIHRLWTLTPGRGYGSAMLASLCELADRHGIHLVLKALPFGRKPYRLDRAQLQTWYSRYGFEGNLRKMIRVPRNRSESLLQAIASK